jgi:pyruvate/2-oxoglutarate dehydrogenase complex dihydrolipoamide dehydrogenase (E3) component
MMNRSRKSSEPGEDERMPDFDVVVLGGGTSGSLIAIEVSSAGRSTALVEAGLVGGEAPYLADMASKSLLQSARRGETWEHAVARRDEVAGHLDDVAAAARLAEAGVTLIRGTGQITGPGTIVVQPNAAKASLNGLAPADPLTLGYTDLVVCTGSEPVAPPVEGLTDVPAWTSAQALTCPDLPRRLVVLGAGPVGCELAQIYAAFGSQVTLVEAEPHVLPGEALFTGEILADALRRTGVDLRLGSAVVKAETTDAGLALTLADGSRVEADRVLLASGRRARLSGLGLEELGISAAPGEMLPLDETCRVVPNVPGRAGPPGKVSEPGKGGPATSANPAAAGTKAGRVWAAGDVTAVAPYTHTARYQAQIVAANLLGGSRAADYRAIPRTVYTSPSVYAVGMSPSLAEATGVELITVSYDLAETARATVEDDDRGRVELYVDAASGDLLVGAAAIGPDAEEWMGEVTLAIRARIPLAVLADVVHAFPTYGEAVEMSLPGLAQRPADRAGAEPGTAQESREVPGPGLAPQTGGGAAADVSGDAGTVTTASASPDRDAPAVPPAGPRLGPGPAPGALPSRKPPAPPTAGPDRVSTQPSHNT